MGGGGDLTLCDSLLIPGAPAHRVYKALCFWTLDSLSRAQAPRRRFLRRPHQHVVLSDRERNERQEYVKEARKSSSQLSAVPRAFR